MFMGSQIFFWGGEEATQISDQILYIWVTIEHVAKFGDNQPNDLKRLGGKKKKERSKQQQQNRMAGGQLQLVGGQLQLVGGHNN